MHQTHRLEKSEENLIFSYNAKNMAVCRDNSFVSSNAGFSAGETHTHTLVFPRHILRKKKHKKAYEIPN